MLDIHLISSFNRFSHKNYSMADDVLVEESLKNGYGLDVILYFGRCKKWSSKLSGGRLNYFVADEKTPVCHLFMDFQYKHYNY